MDRLNSAMQPFPRTGSASKKNLTFPPLKWQGLCSMLLCEKFEIY